MENNIINPHNELTAGPKRNLPRDVFLHLLAMVTLYWSAISVITLCWQYVNYWFPDAANYAYGFSGNIRFAVSSLMIVFPVFILTSWFLNRIYLKESAVRESKIRKWLIYLTLFIASLVIIGDLIFVINTFLGGEITARFILKALSVIVVAAVIFGYYLDDVRRAMPSKMAKYFAWGSAVVVLILIVGAFFIVGSPKNARLAQLDQERVSDLGGIQWQLVNYWQRKQVLPATLNDLNDPISGYVIPVDPETNTPYEYAVKNATSLQFELCATFSLPGQTDGRGNIKTAPVPAMYPYEGMSQVWDHSAGHVCFERTIDKQLYPPVTTPK